MKRNRQFLEIEAGATSAKYGLWVAIISIVIIGGFSVLSNLIYG